MKTSARVVYAQRDGSQPTRVHAPRREIPVIVVPGIAGTRLTDPRTGELAWNPLGSPLGDCAGPFAVDPARLAQISAMLVPDETHPFDYIDDHKKYAEIKHFYNLVTDYYGPLGLHLAKLETEAMKKHNCRLKVYFCGYDWRQDNARSAMRLAGVVDEALRETGARKVILVAHSMGGHVSRYYCRALGGESKVHALFLLGSPILGSPEAYQQAKLGLAGMYVKDIQRSIEHIRGVRGAEATQEDYEVLVDNLAQGLENLAFVAAQSAMDGAGFGGFAKGMLGILVVAMSLGQGRWLTREESRYLARQLPALYQLMPNGVFCANNKNWVIFDPMATGVRPAGFVVELPTVLEAVLGSVTALVDYASGDPSTPGAHARDKVQRFLAGEEGVIEYTGAASRNKMSLPELLTAAKDSIDDDPRKSEALIKELFDQAGRTFFDGRNYKNLYGDIFTGLLDVVQLRAVSAHNLALFYQFDEALTVNYQDAEPLTAESMVKTVCAPVLGAIQGLTDRVHGKEGAEQRKEMKALVEGQKDPGKPRAYIHPRTYALYCEELPTEPGLVLFPRAVVSRDDSNLVKYQVIPGLNFALQPIINPGPMRSDRGDGVVPKGSAHPPDELLSTPFVDAHTMTCVLHGDLPKGKLSPGGAKEAKDWIADQIEKELPRFFGVER